MKQGGSDGVDTASFSGPSRRQQNIARAASARSATLAGAAAGSPGPRLPASAAEWGRTMPMPSRITVNVPSDGPPGAGITGGGVPAPAQMARNWGTAPTSRPPSLRNPSQPAPPTEDVRSPTATMPLLQQQQQQRARGGPPSEAQQQGPKPPRQRLPVPWICLFILAGCIAGLSYSLSQTPGVLAPLSENPLIGPSATALIASGAKVACLIEPPIGQWWRIVSPMWLHAGIIHLLVNMNMLYQAGFPLERAAGPVRFSVIYLCAGVLSMISSSIFAPARVTVGASGALFGIIGAYLGELITNCHLLTLKEGLLAFGSLFFTIALNLAIGLLPLLDNFAHLGGLLGGLAIGFAVLIRVDDFGQVRLRQLVGAAVGVIAYIFMIVGGILLMYYQQQGNEFCSWCHWLSCVPSPWWSCDASTSTADICLGGNGTSTSR